MLLTMKGFNVKKWIFVAGTSNGAMIAASLAFWSITPSICRTLLEVYWYSFVGFMDLFIKINHIYVFVGENYILLKVGFTSGYKLF